MNKSIIQIRTKILLRLSGYLNIRCWTCILFFVANGFLSFAQNIGIGTSTPHASAVLDITSTSDGVLIPRMTTAQRVAINMPATGLLVFDYTTSTYWYYTSQGWTEIRNTWNQSGNDIFNVNSGNVGIGLPNPGTKLEVLGNIVSRNPGASPNGSLIGLMSILADPAICIARGNGSGFFESIWYMHIDDDQSFSIRDQLALELRLSIDSTGGVGIGTTDPDASAALDIQSSTTGFLMPRMTFLQRNEIASPAEGLMIWCTECDQAQTYNGNNWTNMAGDPAFEFNIGQPYRGGVLAYVFQPGDPGYVAGEMHGLVAAAQDLVPAQWGCLGEYLDDCEYALLTWGDYNSLNISAGCGTPGIAAKKCINLVLNDYQDWCLPSKNELEKLYLNRVAIGGFVEEKYWSSTQYSSSLAWIRDFDTGSSYGDWKNLVYGVRPIRYF